MVNKWRRQHRFPNCSAVVRCRSVMDCLRNWLSACFASLNIYIQSFARLVWSRRNIILTTTWHASLLAISRICPQCGARLLRGKHVGDSCFRINLDALIIYANGIFIMIYLYACWQAVNYCKDVIDYWRWLRAIMRSVTGNGRLEKSLRADMLAGLWLFLPKRKTPENGITHNPAFRH